VAVTMAITASGGHRRRAEQALLRMRGASARQIVSFVVAEALLVATAGILGGGVLAGLLGSTFLGPIRFAPSDFLLLTAIALVGLFLAIGAVVVPAWSSSRKDTVRMVQLSTGRWRTPLWQRLYVDLLLLTIAAIIMWRAAGSGYQVVLAPEGIAAAAVDYTAFIAPIFFWIGAALLTVRICGAVIRDNRKLLERLVRPVSGTMTKVVSASLSRQARRLTLSTAMLVLAISFGTSTAIFNRTYNAQARVELTNGADVAALGTFQQPAGEQLAKLAALPGVTSAEAMQHRFACVGADLQHLYGIDPDRISKATDLSDAYFAGKTAAEILATLKATPDGVLVSEETVDDFQLQEGDTINLRLQMASDHQYRAIPFKFIGVAREFPTAPRDSFLVANMDYIARVTGSPSAEYVLMRTNEDPPLVAARATKMLLQSPSIKVTDVSSVGHLIGSSLTSINLDGLTAIELVFAIVMSAVAAGLMLPLVSSTVGEISQYLPQSGRNRSTLRRSFGARAS
jgi:putative ABC transport system permease protein